MIEDRLKKLRYIGNTSKILGKVLDLSKIVKKEIGEDIMRYRVNLKKTKEGYSVWVPGLPGCWSQGKTKTEALENVKDAVKSYLQTVDELKTKESRYVEVSYV